MLNSFFYYFLLFVVVGVPFYFQQRVQAMKEGKTIEQVSLSEINSLSAKLTAFVLVSLYMMSFLAFQVRNTVYAKVGFAACIFSYFLLSSFKGKIVREIREIQVTPTENFNRSFRNLASFGFLYGIYFTIVNLMIPKTGTLPAIVVAMFFIALAAPLFVRIWMPSTRMHPSELKNEILKIFNDAGNPVSEVFLMDTDKFKSYNAMVCGVKYGFGPFKRTLFVTKNLFEVLEMDEIRAVMAHEAAHFKLHHVFKRGVMSIVGIGIAMLAISPVVTCFSIIFNLQRSMAPVFVAVILSIIVQLSFIFRVIRKQEFEADIEALNLGATPSTLCSALEKITDKNGMNHKGEDRITRFMGGHAHPSTEERIMAIHSASMPETAKILPPWKYTVAYASFVIALMTVASITYESRKTDPSRGIASVSDPTTGQILPTEDEKIEEAQQEADE